jgi:hypothetical protein
MTVRKDYLLNGLLRFNYFPMQKKRKAEVPPVFSSSTLSPKIAEKVHNLPLNKDRKSNGFDSIQYKATRYNNVPRLISLPHPKPYIDLCFEIYQSWDKIKHICSNSSSLIRPRKHKDGRIAIMDYETSQAKRNRYYTNAFGKKFLAQADIANCYPSLYSHAIPWALVGIDKAKRQRDPTKWFNKLDKSFRSCSRNETAGVPIGPATSSIACEIILERIDRDLAKKYSYVRFVDDYTAYCSTHTEAEEFVRELSIELMKYKLNLNIKKTNIESLPQAINQDWVGKIREIIPTGNVIGSSQVSNILDIAVNIQKDNPEGSVLKYAASSIVPKLNEHSSIEFLRYIIKLCFHYPVLIPTLNNPLNIVYTNGSANFQNELFFLLDSSIKYGRSDAITWLLYYLKVHGSVLPDKIANNIIKMGDCLAIVLLTEHSAHQKKVVDFAKQLNKKDLYELDNYWLLLYQLYLKGKIRNPYANDDVFKVLKNNNVTFVEF